MRFRTTAVLLLILLGITLDANAQSTGRVSGRVLDQTGAVLPGVVIDLPVNSRELTTTSDDGGRYRFDGVPAGNAELTFRLLNFSVLRRTVAVATGASVTADVVLTLAERRCHRHRHEPARRFDTGRRDPASLVVPGRRWRFPCATLDDA